MKIAHCGRIFWFLSEEFCAILRFFCYLCIVNRPIIYLVALLGLLVGCQKSASYRTVQGVMLGTTLHLVAESPEESAELYALAMDIDAEMKRSMSIFDANSLLSRLNRSETDSVDCHILYNLQLADEIGALSGGAYDVTVAPLVKAWGFGGEGREKEPNLDSLLQFVGREKVALEELEGRTRLWKADERVQLDFNSIAKGYTVDLIARELQARKIENFLVDVGGEIRCQGKNSHGGAWRIGIERPVDGALPGESYEMRLALDRGAMATSGNYRRYFMDSSGRKVAHTIDPKTGRSVLSRLLSATVVADECARADAMATMFMALGSERALKMLEAHPEWRVLLILAPEEEGGAMECRMTPAMQELVLE